MAGGVASALVALTGGFDLQAAGVAVSAHDPLRPLLFAALALTVYLLGT
jgi:hypothetical protein